MKLIRDFIYYINMLFAKRFKTYLTDNISKNCKVVAKQFPVSNL